MTKDAKDEYIREDDGPPSGREDRTLVLSSQSTVLHRSHLTNIKYDSKGFENDER